MTCDHAAKPLALAPVHEIQNREPTEGIIGQSMVTTGSWELRWGLLTTYLTCSTCGEAISMSEAARISFAGRVAVRWNEDNKCWRWRVTNPSNG